MTGRTCEAYLRGASSLYALGGPTPVVMDEIAHTDPVLAVKGLRTGDAPRRGRASGLACGRMSRLALSLGLICVALAGCGSTKPANRVAKSARDVEEKRLDYDFGVLKHKLYTVTVTTTIPANNRPAHQAPPALSWGLRSSTGLASERSGSGGVAAFSKKSITSAFARTGISIASPFLGFVC